MFSGKEEHFYVWTIKIESDMSGVFPNVRGALTFAAESQEVITSTTIPMSVPELGVETSAEIDMYSSSWCCQPSSKVKALTLSCQQEVTMASRVGESFTEGGTRTQRDEHEVS